MFDVDKNFQGSYFRTTSIAIYWELSKFSITSVYYKLMLPQKLKNERNQGLVPFQNVSFVPFRASTLD